MTDQEILRKAALIIEHRSTKRGFWLNVILKLLRRIADAIESEEAR